MFLHWARRPSTSTTATLMPHINTYTFADIFTKRMQCKQSKHLYQFNVVLYVGEVCIRWGVVSVQGNYNIASMLLHSSWVKMELQSRRPKSYQNRIRVCHGLMTIRLMLTTWTPCGCLKIMTTPLHRPSLDRCPAWECKSDTIMRVKLHKTRGVQ